MSTRTFGRRHRGHAFAHRNRIRSAQSPDLPIRSIIDPHHVKLSLLSLALCGALAARRLLEERDPPALRLAGRRRGRAAHRRQSQMRRQSAGADSRAGLSAAGGRHSAEAPSRARRTVPASTCRSSISDGYTPARPMDVLSDAHMFTADHPEVASYVPCYCGCGSAGHKNNADCFVKGRDARGPRHASGSRTASPARFASISPSTR